MKIYLQASVASVLLCAVMVLFAFASDSVDIMEEPLSVSTAPSPEEIYHGETPIILPDMELLPSDSSSSEPVSEVSSESGSEDASENSESASSSEVSAEQSSSEISSEPVSSGPESSSAPSSEVQSSSSSPSSEPSSSSSSPESSSAPSKPPVSSSEPSSESSAVQPPIPSEPSSESSTVKPPIPSEPSSKEEPAGETILARINGSVQQVDVYEYLCYTVEAEMGSTFSSEALKAQAVAAYSYIKYENARGVAVSLPQKAPSQKTRDAVSAVLGKAVYYNGTIAFTPYFASSAGWTNPSSEVWGGSYSYLTRVESIYDPSSVNKNVKAVFSTEKVQTGLENYLDINLEGSDPNQWLNIISMSDSGYVLSIEITDADGRTHTISGRQLRENVLSYGIRSHAFTVSYENNAFTFITNGYGHGVGMSQTGANGYAQNGWNYIQILNHYYPGTSVR